MKNKFMLVLVSLLRHIVFGTIILMALFNFTLFTSQDLKLIEIITLFMIFIHAACVFLIFYSCYKVCIHIELFISTKEIKNLNE